MPSSKYLKPCSPLLLAFALGLSQGAAAVGVGSAPWVGESLKGIPCDGSIPQNYGPWDYTLNKNRLGIVEQFHFTPKVEQLLGGENATGPTSDLDYTLKVIPNHHRALNSTIRFHYRQVRDEASKTAHERRKEQPGFRLKSPVECYLQRAVNYSPKDAVSLMLYATFLHREGLEEESAERYKAALALEPDSANIEYNYALLLVDTGEFGEARKIAQKLYAANFPLPGLKNKLISADQWP